MDLVQGVFLRLRRKQDGGQAADRHSPAQLPQQAALTVRNPLDKKHLHAGSPTIDGDISTVFIKLAQAFGFPFNPFAGMEIARLQAPAGIQSSEASPGSGGVNRAGFRSVNPVV
jgi:hypothetical protein